MDYPLLLGGEPAGRLSVERQGLYTYMEAVTDRGGSLLRVWVQGGGQEAYLGVMQPWNGGMFLRRKLSRNDMAAFPSVIEQASDQRLELTQAVDITEITPPEPEEAAEAAPAPLPEPEPELRTQPEEAYVLWTEHRDGSLTARDGERSLLALPARLRRVPPGADLRRIGGREYLVFRY